MILDTSAVIAMLRLEHSYETLYEELERARTASMSAASYVELHAVLRNEPELQERASALFDLHDVGIAPLDEPQARIAANAYQRFGKGSGHRARLNMGDCFSYALAFSRGEPLLCVGDDFVHTDIATV